MRSRYYTGAYFNPHTPHTGCDDSTGISCHLLCNYFNPRTHAGCDTTSSTRQFKASHFNPRTSYEVRRVGILPDYTVYVRFQSTHLIRGATPPQKRNSRPNLISIHAPHARCDTTKTVQSTEATNISIHAPYTGCDKDTAHGRTDGPISIHAPHARCDLLLTRI